MKLKRIVHECSVFDVIHYTSLNRAVEAIVTNPVCGYIMHSDGRTGQLDPCTEVTLVGRMIFWGGNDG